MKLCWIALAAGTLLFVGCGNDTRSSAGAGGSAGIGGAGGSAGAGGEGGHGGNTGATCPGECAVTEYCAGETCDRTGTCEERPTACTTEFNPVCGCDGNDYGNPCAAASAGVRVEFEGPCAPL